MSSTHEEVYVGDFSLNSVHLPLSPSRSTSPSPSLSLSSSPSTPKTTVTSRRRGLINLCVIVIEDEVNFETNPCCQENDEELDAVTDFPTVPSYYPQELRERVSDRVSETDHSSFIARVNGKLREEKEMARETIQRNRRACALVIIGISLLSLLASILSLVRNNILHDDNASTGGTVWSGVEGMVNVTILVLAFSGMCLIVPFIYFHMERRKAKGRMVDNVIAFSETLGKSLFTTSGIQYVLMLQEERRRGFLCSTSISCHWRWEIIIYSGEKGGKQETEEKEEGRRGEEQ